MPHFNLCAAVLTTLLTYHGVFGLAGRGFSIVDPHSWPEFRIVMVIYNLQLNISAAPNCCSPLGCAYLYLYCDRVDSSTNFDWWRL